jgi:hypothetical protein
MLREEKRAVQTGTYYIPPVSRHISVLNAVEYGQRVIVKGQRELMHQAGTAGVIVSAESATSMRLPDNSIDYVFTDPAYVDKVQYGELNFVWDAWLGFDGGWLKDEIVVNPFRSKSIDDWDRDLRTVLTKLYAALKPKRWLSLCYHDTDPGTWARLQNALLDTGFEIHTVTVLDPKQKSSNQVTAERVVKSDLVVNCRKPRASDRKQTGSGELKLVSDRVREILIETLSHSAGQPRERLWDIVLKRLLSRGQMAEHRFDDILLEIAFRSESNRWFLKDEFENLSDSDVNNEGNAGDALASFARLRMTGVTVGFAAEIALHHPDLGAAGVDEAKIENYIRRELIEATTKFELGGRLKGVEFYDCLFFYLTRWLKGRPSGRVPRRNLADFMDEYLVRFKEGDKWLYRPPDDAESATLRQARQTGLGRRIRQYVSFLRGEGDYPRERLPDARTLVAWLKHCAAFGLAEEGVAVFERGGLVSQLQYLSEDERYDADDYYTQCRRRAAKTAVDEEPLDEGSVDEAEGLE